MANLIYLGNYASVDTYEGNYNAEDAHQLEGITADAAILQVVSVGFYDANGDGKISDDECNPGDELQYNAGAGAVSNETDSTLTATVNLTLTDGSVVTKEVVLIQQDNGDVFISELNSSLDDLSIASIEIESITGSCYSGWYYGCSIDNTVIASSGLDGTVEGTDGADVIDADYAGDPEGDFIDAGDALLPGHGPNDDLVYAYGGDDLVLAGDGDDTVYGGEGDDTLCGQDGDDTLFGEAGNDILEGMNNNDVLFGGAGDDRIYGDAGTDVAYGGDGDDKIYGGSDNDTLTGGAGNDEISGGTGDDVIRGDGDIDCATGGDIFEERSQDISNMVFYYDTNGDGQIDYSVKVDDFPDGSSSKWIGNDADVFYAQMNAWVVAGDPALDGDAVNIGVSIKGGNQPTDYYQVVGNTNGGAPDEGPTDNTGPVNDAVVVYNDFYAVYDPAAADPADGGGSDATYDDVLHGNDGDDTILGECGDDSIFGGKGNDALYGGEGNDYVVGGVGQDFVAGGAGDDTLIGGIGDDVLVGGAGADAVYGGDDQDVIIGGAGDVADGGAGGTDFDILDLTGQGPFILTNVTPDSNGNGIDGTVVFVDADGDPTGETLVFTEIEKILGEELNDDPIAVADEFAANEDDGAEIIGNVLDNDSDPDGDDLSVGAVAGDAANIGQPVAGDNGGLITIATDGTVTFDPNGEFESLAAGEEATTTVTYTVSDGRGGTASETVTITVTGENDAPDAVNNAYVVNANEEFGDTDGNVITDNTGVGTDSDVDGDTLEVSAVDGLAGNVGNAVAGDNGGLFIINTDGTVDFDANGAFDALGLGDSATTSVSYTISDGSGGFDTATVSFTVNGINNGTVEGTSGADVMVPGYVDADGDIVDGGDAILPGHTGDDDLIYGYGGDDSIQAGNGNDTVFGGTGNDTIAGNDGDDSVYGGIGNDTVEGGAGDDTIDTSNYIDPLPDVGYPQQGAFPGYPADADPSNDLDLVYGGAGNDTIRTGDDDDVIYGGTGNDHIDAGIDDDYVEGGDGNDTIIGSEGNDEIKGGAGDDLIYGGLDDSAPDFVNIPDNDGDPNTPDDLVDYNNNDTLYGGSGNDTIFGRDDDDILFGGTGDDVLDGGVDDDLLDGGTGADLLIGGQGDDTILGGDGNDTIIGGIGDDVQAGGFGSDLFIGGNDGDNVVGGEDPDDSDVDVLDLTGSNVDFITYNDGDPESGVVTFLDGSTMTFAEIENVIPCFTPGTTIATPKGERLVEDLRVGDRVITRDNGIQEIAWVGRKPMTGKALAANPHLKPILIKAGALGDGLPERDMMVSPNHRVLVASELTQLYFEEREVLAAAKHMTGAQGIHALNVTNTNYIHFMCERHEVVLSNGAWTESFQPGDYSLKGLGNSQRNEIFELFPELATQTGLANYQSARRQLKKHEAQLLMK